MTPPACRHVLTPQLLSEGGNQWREGADSCLKTIDVDRPPHWSAYCFKEKKKKIFLDLIILWLGFHSSKDVSSDHITHSFILLFSQHLLSTHCMPGISGTWRQVNAAESLPSRSSPHTLLICCALTPVITHFSCNVPVLSMSQVVLPPFVQLSLAHTVHSDRSPKAGRILVSCLLVKCWCYDSCYATVAFRMLTLKIRTCFICSVVFVYMGASVT